MERELRQKSTDIHPRHMNESVRFGALLDNRIHTCLRIFLYLVTVKYRGINLIRCPLAGPEKPVVNLLRYQIVVGCKFVMIQGRSSKGFPFLLKIKVYLL